MRSRRSCWFVGVLLLSSFAVACQDDDPTGPSRSGIHGRVTLVASGEPLIGASTAVIRASDLQPAVPATVTDANGAYSFEDLSPGEYVVFVDTDGLEVSDRSAPLAVVEAGRRTRHDIRLAPSIYGPNGGEEYRIEGRILDDVTDAPVPHAWVGSVNSAWWGLTKLFDGRTQTYTSFSDSSGWFSIEALAVQPGRLVGLQAISVSHPRYQPFTLTGGGELHFEVYPPLPLPSDGSNTLTVEIRLQPMSADSAGLGAIRGTVTDINGPVAGLWVAVSIFGAADPDTLLGSRLDPEVASSGRTALTDGDGSYLIAALAPGLYAVHAGYRPDDGYITSSQGGPGLVAVGAGQTRHVSMQVQKALLPVSPTGDRVVRSRTPEMVWRLPDAEQYTAVTYDLFVLAPHPNYAQWPVRVIYGLKEPRWRVPSEAAFARGTPVRWYVIAFGTSEGSAANLGTFEAPSSFTVAD